METLSSVGSPICSVRSYKPLPLPQTKVYKLFHLLQGRDLSHLQLILHAVKFDRSSSKRTMPVIMRNVTPPSRTVSLTSMENHGLNCREMLFSPYVSLYYRTEIKINRFFIPINYDIFLIFAQICNSAREGIRERDRTMRVVDLIKSTDNTAFSFEILPPLVKETGIEKL